MNTRESVRFGWSAIVITVLLVVALILGTLMYLGVLPTLLGLEREAVQSSRQYVEAKQQSMLNLVDEYQAAEKQIAMYEAADATRNSNVIKTIELQQKAIMNSLRNQADMIPESEVPASVREFLLTHR